jgi:adenine-specific DNA-methyltransferase
VEAFDIEERLILGGQMDDGAVLDPEVCRKILSLPGSVASSQPVDTMPPAVDEALCAEKAAALTEIEKRNLRYFDEEVNKLDLWAEDLKTGLEREIKDLDQQIRDVKRLSTAAPTLQEKLEHQKRLKELDTERRSKRKRLFEAQDEIDAKRDGLIGEIEQRLKQKVIFDPLMTIRWAVTNSGSQTK